MVNWMFQDSTSLDRFESRMKVLIKKATRDISTRLQIFNSEKPGMNMEIPLEQFRSFLAVHMAIAWTIYLADELPDYDGEIYSDSYLFLDVEEDSFLNTLIARVLEQNILSDYQVGYLTAFLQTCLITIQTNAQTKLWTEFILQFSNLLFSMSNYSEAGNTIFLNHRMNRNYSEKTNLNKKQKQLLYDLAMTSAYESIQAIHAMTLENPSMKAKDMIVHEYIAKSALIPILFGCAEGALSITNHVLSISKSHDAISRGFTKHDMHIARLADECSSEIWRVVMTCQTGIGDELIGAVADLIMHYILLSTCETVLKRETIACEEDKRWSVEEKEIP